MNIVTIFFIVIFLIVILSGYAISRGRREFRTWFEEVLKQAPSYGFKKETIDEFDEAIWEGYFYEGYDPEAAIKKHLTEH